MSTTAPSPPSSANSHPPTTTTTSSTTTIRLLPIDPSTLHTLAHVGYHAFFDFSISVSQPPEFPSVKSYHDVLLAELDKQETFALMAVREGEGSERSATYVEGVGEVLGSVLMDCTAGEVAAIGPISVASTAQKTGVGRKVPSTPHCLPSSAQSLPPSPLSADPSLPRCASSSSAVDARVSC